MVVTKNRKTFTCIKDSSGDLPRSVIGRKGVIIGRCKEHDDMSKKAYKVRFFGWKSTKILWEDEFIFNI